MGDFASAAMSRLIVAGLMRLGITPAPAAPGAAALVPLEDKRALLQVLVARGGHSALLSLGQGLPLLAGDPLYQALAAAQGPQEFLARWCRMERYIHSRHRLLVTPQDDGASIEHRALRPPPPWPAENLVVLGVVAAGLDRFCVHGLQVHIAGVPAYPVPDAPALERLAAQQATGQWQLRWQALRASAETDLPPFAPQSEPPVTPSMPDPADRLARWLLHDPMARPRLADAAAHLALSPRSLQRVLASQGLNFGEVMARTRCAAAAWHLVHRPQSTAETGFLCGYADQAHFTREFRRRTGVTPAAYRREFAQNPRPAETTASP